MNKADYKKAVELKKGTKKEESFIIIEKKENVIIVEDDDTIVLGKNIIIPRNYEEYEYFESVRNRIDKILSKAFSALGGKDYDDSKAINYIVHRVMKKHTTMQDKGVGTCNFEFTGRVIDYLQDFKKQE